MSALRASTRQLGPPLHPVARYAVWEQLLAGDRVAVSGVMADRAEPWAGSNLNYFFNYMYFAIMDEDWTLSDFTRVNNPDGYCVSLYEAFMFTSYCNNKISVKKDITTRMISCSHGFKWRPINLDKNGKEQSPERVISYIDQLNELLEINYIELIKKEALILLIAKINLFAECIIPDIITHMKTLI